MTMELLEIVNMLIVYFELLRWEYRIWYSPDLFPYRIYRTDHYNNNNNYHYYLEQPAF